jgi:hypothetical protein
VCLCVCVWSRVEFVSSVGRPPPQRAVALNSGRIFDFPSVCVCGLSGVGRSVLVSCVCGLFPYLIGNDILIVIETHQLIRKIPSIGGNLQSITIAQLLLLLRWRICFVIFFNHPIRRRVFLFFSFCGFKSCATVFSRIDRPWTGNGEIAKLAIYSFFSSLFFSAVSITLFFILFKNKKQKCRTRWRDSVTHTLRQTQKEDGAFPIYFALDCVHPPPYSASSPLCCALLLLCSYMWITRILCVPRRKRGRLACTFAESWLHFLD